MKNLTAAGEGRMRRYGKTFTVADPQVMPKSAAAPSVNARLPFEYALLLTRVS